MSTQLQTIDYAFCSLFLIMYIIIGIYFGCFGLKQKSAKQYMYGIRSLRAIPVGISIFSSSVSAIAMLGNPLEIYLFGAQFVMHIIGVFLSVIVTWIFVLPVFNASQNFQSPYEYYEYRFDKRVRFLSSMIYIINGIFIVPIVLYSCCLPISEATGINVIICSILLGGICVLYTMIGGFQTVIWTDVLQAVLMFVTLLCLITVSVFKAGGFKIIWENAENGGRLNFFDFDINPFKRLTFWSVVFGAIASSTAIQACSASSLQRYLSVATERESKISIFVAACGYVLSTIFSAIIGLCIYTKYQKCDPVKSKELKSYNQLTSHFALENIQYIPGFSGIFITGLLSAGLSTMAAELNTISGMIYYDYIQKIFKKLNDVQGAFIMKLLVLILGIVFILMVFLMQKIKYLIPATIMFSGTGHGLKLGLILLGTTFPQSNTKGALCGSLVSGILMSWIAANAFIYDVGTSEMLPVSIENCSFVNFTFIDQEEYLNYTTPIIHELSNSTIKPEPFILYKLSFLYYVLVGALITVCVALIVTYITGVNDYKNMNPKLFIPLVRPKTIIKQDEDVLLKIIKNT